MLWWTSSLYVISNVGNYLLKVNSLRWSGRIKDTHTTWLNIAKLPLGSRSVQIRISWLQENTQQDGLHKTEGYVEDRQFMTQGTRHHFGTPSSSELGFFCMVWGGCLNSPHWICIPANRKKEEARRVQLPRALLWSHTDHFQWHLLARIWSCGYI